MKLHGLHTENKTPSHNNNSTHKKKHSPTKLPDLRLLKENYKTNLKTYKELFQSKPLLLKPLQTEEPETKPFGTMLQPSVDHSTLNTKPQLQEEEPN